MDCVKVYLCSNPEDFVLERAFLHQTVFPKLREYCRSTYGVEFSVFDPYEAASRYWPGQQERCQILEDLRKTSLGPFFVGLVGEQYGDASLPERIEVSEFQDILQVSWHMGFGTDTLEKCYQRDENAIPSSFILREHPRQPREKYIKKQNPIEGNSWFMVLQEGKRILHDVVNLCLREGTMTHGKAQKYLQSALENDIRCAYEGHSNEDIARCACYVHKVCIPRKRNSDVQCQRLSDLCDNFLPSFVASHKAIVHCTETKCSHIQDYTSERRLDFAVGLGEQMYEDLRTLIDHAASNKSLVEVERFGQKDLCQVFSSLYRIDRAEIEKLRSYLEAENTKFPLIVSGRPCLGKTVLLAHCAMQASVWLKNLDPDIHVYFIDVNISFRLLLNDICGKVASANACANIFQLKEAFKRLLTARSQSKSPLVIILDGLDQLQKTDGQPDLTWLPQSLAPNVKLIFSVSTNSPRLLTSLKRFYPDSTLFCELQSVESKRCSQLLANRLQESNRKITSGQQMYVNVAFKKSSVPLYVELLHKQVVHWTSEFEVTSETLDQDVYNNISLLFNHLEKKHGKVVVSKALSYLTLTRYGMTPAELTDVLSCDDDILVSFLPKGDALPLRLRIPEALVQSLLLDLKGFLVLRNIFGTKTFYWVSRQFGLVVCNQYLSSEQSRQMIHHVLSDYFTGTWANGTAKPLITNVDRKMVGSFNIPQNVYIDRQVSSQPFYFSTSMSLSARRHPNLRKLLNLPFHLLKSARFQELGYLMMSQDFLQAMFQAKLAMELFLWLEKTSQLVFRMELQSLKNILRSSSCLLSKNPADLPAVLQAKLLPFWRVFPSLPEFVNNRSKVMSTVIPSVPSVPCSQCTVGSLIRDSAGSCCGMVMIVLENGTALFCDGGTIKRFNLTQPNCQFLSVCSSGNTFLLSTNSGKLVLWDACVQTEPVEFQAQSAVIHKSSVPKGVLVFDGIVLVWWKGCNIASVFVDRVEHSQLVCTCMITSVSASSEMVYCGQTDSSVTMFDWHNGQVLSSFTCPKDMAIIEIITNGFEIISFVDQGGNLFAWNLGIMSEPVLIREYHCQIHGKVLNTSYKGGNVLLICKKEHIQMLDVNKTNLHDQFRPSRGKEFQEATLDQSSQFILALLSNCPFILVWSCASGQCLLSLDTANLDGLTLLKCEAPYLVALTCSTVLFWDMDFIVASALAPKSGKSIKILAVGSHGEFCYSADGSALVWKWALSSGTVQCQFLHQGLVESLCVSEDGSYLVSIANRDIYVWETRNGQNVYRISGSQAYQVLITPKGNSGVALSETGLSRVWKVQSGHLICTIHLHLRNAAISPEGTFLLGLRSGNLLAASLWSGNVSRCFSCTDQSDAVAFHSVPDHPDYVIVALASGAVYTWRLSEDTTCHQIQLPDSSLCESEIFRVSSDGETAILSLSESSINFLLFSRSQLLSLRTEGPVVRPYVAISFCGSFAIYACFSSMACHNSSCDLHKKPMLIAVRLTDGKTLGRIYLCKTPSSFVMSKELLVFVGFEDGSVAVYALFDTVMGTSKWKGYKQGQILPSPSSV